jgi:hypothetical protein
MEFLKAFFFQPFHLVLSRFWHMVSTFSMQVQALLHKANTQAYLPHIVLCL